MAILVALGGAGLLASGTTTKVALIAAGVLLFVLIPAMIQHRLENLAQRVSDANRTQAAEFKRSLPSKPLVKLFAPAAWVTLQDAQIALRLGDGRTAARLFAETAQLCKRPDAVMLVSAQAHALVVANERKAARELLNKLAAAKLLGPRDQLDLGIVMLLDSHKKSRQAMAYIEAARKTIGDHPRVIAAMALALQRAERVDEAAELLERSQISLQEEPDPVVEALVNRARRDMRRYIEAQLRRERRARSRRTTVVVTSEHAVSEIVSGEIGSRGDSGAVPQAAAKNESMESGISSAVADAIADSEALRARGWQDPSSIGKPEEGNQPKVKVELRDPSIGEPIRIEGSYALKKKEEVEKGRPRRRRDPGPAIDIDLAVDEGEDEDEVDESPREPDAPMPRNADAATARTKPEAGAKPAEETKPAEEAKPAEEPKKAEPVGAPPVETPGGLAASLLIAASATETPTPAETLPPPRDEASDIRRKASLAESLAAALKPLSAPGEGKEAEAKETEAEATPEKVEADAPMAIRRKRTVASASAGPKPPPFPTLPVRGGAGTEVGAGGSGMTKLPTFAPPSARGEGDAAKPSFTAQRDDKK
ncbi:MAG: hypothetical protein H6711_21520 [Myxococcales bacterium]|nr:hypothetical protein [Myxococcales bacterium]